MDSWKSRRSPILSTKGMCCSSQPLASAAGVKILNAGGSAADAAVAMAAVLNVVEPCSTGIGGDAFALYYDSSQEAGERVSCFEGNGASSELFTPDLLLSRNIGCGAGMDGLSPSSGLCVTVPGAASLWEELVLTNGRLSLLEVLTPAIEMAENGFVLGPVTAEMWESCNSQLQGDEASRVFRPEGRVPREGELLFNKDLADTFRTLANEGAPNGFYRGRVAEAIAAAVKDIGGVLTLSDLGNHCTRYSKPISTSIRGMRVFETPPPSQGLAVLLALNIIDKVLPVSEVGEDSAEDVHKLIECMRLALLDALVSIGDPEQVTVPLDVLLSDEHAYRRAAEVLAGLGRSESDDPVSDVLQVESLRAFSKGETVYLCAVDQLGNACSLINSNYQGYGTGVVPTGCGFTLHNRGMNFSLQTGHANSAGPNRRPFHTIIPALITRAEDDSLYAVMGVMGGFMQAQGQVQVLRRLLDKRDDPQTALDAPRWCLEFASDPAQPVSSSTVALEEGLQAGNDVAQRLTARGLGFRWVTGSERALFGRGQVITRTPLDGVLCAGSDPRSDGCAVPAV